MKFENKYSNANALSTTILHRFYIIFWRIGHQYDDDIRLSLKYVLSKCYIGDW